MGKGTMKGIPSNAPLLSQGQGRGRGAPSGPNGLGNPLDILLPQPQRAAVEVRWNSVSPTGWSWTGWSWSKGICHREREGRVGKTARGLADYPGPGAFYP